MITTVIGGAVIASAAPVFAQVQAPEAAPGAAAVDDIVVTGSIIRRRNADSTSPLTVLGSEDLEKRGATTVASAIQSLAGNNAGALPDTFSGAFAAGASGASLRGLLVNSTLVLVDGLRGPFYPLADDGQRNFVDLNSIPASTIDRIEVLQDGASSTYGADAIAGVINIITRKNFQGLTVKSEYGVSEYGDGESPSFSAIWGKGNLNTDGWNFYLSGEYKRDEFIWNRDRDYPYNTANLTPTTGYDANGKLVYRTNGVINGIQGNGAFRGVSTATQFGALVRPYDPTNTTAQGPWQLLATNCPSPATPHTLTAEELRLGGVTNIAPGTVICQLDAVKEFRTIQPQNERFSLSGRFTKRFSNGAEAYVSASYYQNETDRVATPNQVALSAPPAVGVSRYIGTALTLPVRLKNGDLNPQNPFASQGQVARILASLYDIPSTSNLKNENIRVAAGLQGTFASDWDYNLRFTAGRSSLDFTRRGQIHIQHLLDVIADGSYNFIDQTKNSQQVRDYVSPDNVQTSVSEIVQGEASVSRALWTLPGGPLSVGLGASWRWESIDNPSANPFKGGPTDGWLGINSFYSKGDRSVTAAYFEIDAPLLSNLNLDVAGRYDDYSTGQSAFSPKVGVRYRPFEALTFRATYSEGFRIPSIAEGNSQVTGYAGRAAPASFQTLHGNDGYGQSYQLGLTTVGNPDLKPETSDSVNLGFVFTPTRNLTFSVDHFRINKNGVIAGGDSIPALNAYFSGQPIPAGYTVIPGVPNPNKPDLLPLPGFILSPFQNLNSLETSGFDFAATADFQLTPDIRWSSSFSATYIDKFNQSFPLPGGEVQVQHYAGSLGPCNVGGCLGTPQWRGNWQNSLDFGRTVLTATAYYTDGYQLQAEDYGDVIGRCVDANGKSAASANGTYADGVTPILCKTDSFIKVDLNATFQINDGYQLFATVLNAFGADAPLDPATYGGYQYQTAWAQSGAIGRYFKVGFKATF
ncbi:TonB-dependent receptor plug domain-containing protein [Brevundimonas nasdae]|jgi:iron complex outermembrane recepter protein|uniref:TonB-dependent receptor plug domain-containing protein n=1 Tax=Brevundimonas nasdae TaxID=172043 RepID=UPI002896E4CB|nr:TonB-dependent receptor [Brevundimonas nasdae]